MILTGLQENKHSNYMSNSSKGITICLRPGITWFPKVDYAVCTFSSQGENENSNKKNLIVEQLWCMYKCEIESANVGHVLII